MKFYKRGLVIFFIAYLLCSFMSACSARPSRQAVVAGDEIAMMRESMLLNNQLPRSKETMRSVSNELLPDVIVPHPGLAKKLDHRFDIRVQNAPARAFFASLVKGTPYSIAVSPEIQGTITINLKSVTVEEAMEAVRDIYGYEYETTPYGFRVLVPSLQTRIYHLNYIDVHRMGQSQVAINPGINSNVSTNNITPNGTTSVSNGIGANGQSSGNGESSSTVTTLSDADFWTSLQKTLTTIIGKESGHSVVVNSQSGMVVVNALPSELRQIEKYLISSQLIMNRQVILEAKVLEVQLNAGYEAGVDWNLLGIEQQANQFLTNNSMPFMNIFTITATKGAGFSFVLKSLQSQGKVKVLSSPRISTVNNQKAIIKVGTDQYFVTNVTNNTTNSVAGVNNAQNVDLEPFFSGIALDVTPQIDKQGNVTLHVHPVVSQVSANQISFTLNGLAQTIPSALTTIRESDSIIHARDRQVVVIGGLMQNSVSDQQNATPILGKVPVIGSLFRAKNQSSSRTELIILLRPVLTKDDPWNDDMRRAAKDFQEMNCDSYDYQIKAPA